MTHGGKQITLVLWDNPSGEEDYHEYRLLSYAGTCLFLVEFDIANPSYKSKWIPEIDRHCPALLPEYSWAIKPTFAVTGNWSVGF